MNQFIYRRVLSCLLPFASVLLSGCVFPSRNNEPKETVHISYEYNHLSSERQDLMAELEAMNVKYDTLVIYNSEILPLVDQQQDKIVKLASNVRNPDADLNSIREEMRVCCEVQAYCLAKNCPVYSEGAVYPHESATSSDAYRRPEEDGELSVSTGLNETSAVISADDFRNLALRERSSGISVDTDRAAKTETIKSCFNLRKNRLAKPGTRTLQMAIVGPDGQVLTGKKSGTTAVNGAEVQYSESLEVEHRQADTDVCIQYTAKEGFDYKRGKYNIYIYEGGNMIGRSSITLK